MVFFEANKFSIDISLDGNGVFAVGGVITGRVIITCTEPATIRGITLSYYVIEHAVPFPAAANVTEAQLVKNIEEDAEDHNGKEIFKVSYLLCGARSGSEMTVRPGNYSYPFSIQVPTSMPGSVPGCFVAEGTTCCHCCCRCCGGVNIFVALQHALQVKVIIPFSFKDKKAWWPVTVLRGIHPAVAQAPTPAHSLTAGEVFPHTCQTCCPGCICSPCKSMNHSFLGALRLPKTFFVFGVDGSIPFFIDAQGPLSAPLRVRLMRQVKLLNGGPQHLGDLTQVVSEVRVAPTQQYAQAPLSTTPAAPSVSIPGYIPLDMTRLKHSHTLDAKQLQLRFYVEVQADDPSGICGALREDDVVKIPVCLAQCVTPAAPNLFATYVPQGQMPPQLPPGAASSGFPPQYPQPQQPPQYGAPDYSYQGAAQGNLGYPPMPELYAYAPPLGMPFAPVAPVSEHALPPAVWGTPMPPPAGSGSAAPPAPAPQPLFAAGPSAFPPPSQGKAIEA